MRFVIVFIFVILGCFIASPMRAEDMTVSQAYQALPHQRTQFSVSYAKMSKKESRYLDHLFFVTDLAFRERMMMMHAFRAGTGAAYIKVYNTEISNLLGSFEFIDPPTELLEQVENLVVGSINEQREFFNIWDNARGTEKYKKFQKNVASHKYVQSSHQKLIQAYSTLQQTYTQEMPHNQQSFYDHLCALDFL